MSILGTSTRPSFLERNSPLERKNTTGIKSKGKNLFRLTAIGFLFIPLYHFNLFSPFQFVRFQLITSLLKMLCYNTEDDLIKLKTFGVAQSHNLII